MDQVAQIREKIDIVSFLSDYISLKKAGRNFRANCPFHGEKTPSFFVSPERQMWHCFGCGLGGDVYSFLMQYEKMEFPEALRFLAKRAGIALENRHGDSKLASKKELLYEINSFAKEYYHYVLTKHASGKQALTYLKERGVNERVIETFKLGFSPGTDQSLVNYLMKKKQYTKEDILEAGLAFVGRSGLVDFFRGRLMFPLIDHRDNVVGFSGRVLDGNAPSKYINTRETTIYHKSEHVFGLNITKEAIRREKQAIIVEGEFDVMSCFEHGIGNVIAVKGTALTEAHVALLHRYADKITFCFDDDKAGFEAIKKSLIVVEKKGLTPTVIVVPKAQDPDEALKSDPGLFKKAVKEDVGVYDYLLEKFVKANDVETAEGKRTIVAQFLVFVALITNEVVKEHYLRRLSNEVDTSYESIAKELQRVVALAIAPKPVVAPPKQKRPREEILEEYLLALLVQSEEPKKIVQQVVSVLSDSMTKERAYQKILVHLLSHVEKHDEFNHKHFGDGLPDELVRNYDASILFPLPQFETQEKVVEEALKTARVLRKFYLQKKLKDMAAEIHKKEADGTEESNATEEINELKKKYSKLASQLQTSS